MSELSQELLSTFVLAAISLIVLWIAKERGFFKLATAGLQKSSLSFGQTTAVFALYFGAVLFVVPLLIAAGRFLGQSPLNHSLRFSVAVHFMLSFTIAGLLIFFWRTLDPAVKKTIWRGALEDKSYWQDVAIGLVAWPIAYPLVFFVNQALNLLVYFIFQVKELPDQAIVSFLKMTMQDPIALLLNLIAIVVLAPFIEELMFRGFLQTYIRKFFHPVAAIVLSSFCFACFHFSPGQGLGNIPIIGSLWAFALFLGFVYERQGSLIASIALHAAFNLLSMFNVYFFGTQCL